MSIDEVGLSLYYGYSIDLVGLIPWTSKNIRENPDKKGSGLTVSVCTTTPQVYVSPYPVRVDDITNSYIELSSSPIHPGPHPLPRFDISKGGKGGTRDTER